MSENTKKKSIMDKFSDAMMGMAEPLGRFAQIPAVAAVQEGLASMMSVLIIGSLFLIIGLLGTGSMTPDGSVLIPFLEPYVGKFIAINSLTLGFMGLYAAYGIAHTYGEKLHVDAKQSGMIGLVAFFVISFAGGEVDISYFGSNALFAAVVTSLVSVKIYATFIKKNFVIKLPDSVPPAIGKAFASLVPMAVIITLCWIIRAIIGFNFPVFMNNFLAPLIKAGDSIGGMFIIMFLMIGLWSVGLNGPGMVGPVTTPIFTTVLAGNAAAKLSGGAMVGVATNSFVFSYMWVASVWPVIFWLVVSKSKGNKAVGIASTPALIFNIIEPCMFSTPVVMNPFLMIPFIFTGVVGTMIPYILTKIGLLGAFYAEVPWATPPVISALVCSGDWKHLVMQVIILIFGIVVYAPFFKMHERMQAAEAAAANG